MAPLFHILQAQPFIVIFGVVAIGMACGRLAIKGISLGSVVCILLAGLGISIWASSSAGVSLELPELLKTIFFNLFIFAVGVNVGPQFFAGLERDGWHMVTIGVIVGVLAPLTSYLCGWMFHLPQGAVAGVLAGSNNSSASFGTASSAMQSGAMHLLPGSTHELVAGMLSAAFALCYTVSEVQFVLYMKWLPKLAGIDPAASARAFQASMRRTSSAPLPGTAEAGDLLNTSIPIRAYRITGATLAGQTIAAIRAKAPRVSIELVRRDGEWITIADETRLEDGDEVLVGAPIDAQVKVREVLGPELPDADARALMPVHTVDVVIREQRATGISLPDLTSTLVPGVYPAAVFRAGQELPANADTTLKKGDVVRVTGTDARIAQLGKQVGPVIRANHSSDILTLAIGLIIGAAIGAIPVPMFGVHVAFGATAVLITGILFGWLKTRHPALGGPIAEGARRLMEELGLNVFTAVLAVNSGPAVAQVVMEGPVVSLILSCLIVSSAPAMVAWWIGLKVLKLNPALLLGAIAGARQNTASLRVAQRMTASAVPGIAYPVPLAVATVSLSVAAYFFALFD